MACLRLLGTLLCLTSLTMPLAAATITFDDIDANAGDAILSNYQNFTWSNFSAYTNVPGFPGFTNGIASPANAAYSGGELLGSTVSGRITAAGPFDFTSAYLGAGYYDNLAVTVQGFLAGMPYYSQTVTVGTTGAQAFNFGFTGIDTLIIFGSRTATTADPYNCGPVNCTQFTIDDVVLTPSSQTPPGPPIEPPVPPVEPPPVEPPPPPPSMPEVPEPSPAALLALGIAALFPLRRYRRGHR